MKLGRYGNGNTKFNKLSVGKLPLHWFNTTDYHGTGCGACALSALTGVNPHSIKYKKDGHYSDRFMTSFLRNYNISVYEMNQSNLSNNKSWVYNITDQHVILSSNLIQPNEATWGIHWNNTDIHNFTIQKADSFHTINFPIVTAYILFSKTWIPTQSIHAT